MAKTSARNSDSVSTITAFVSVVIGTGMIRIYLSNFSIPISPLDAFSAVSLQTFVFFFITILGSAVAIFLVPFCAPYFVPLETRESLKELFGRRDIPPNTVRPRLAFSIAFWKEYLMFYLPTLGLIWATPVIMYFELPVWTIFPVILSSFIISVLLLSVFKLKGRPKSESLWSLLWLNSMTIGWMLLVEISMLKAWGYAVNESIVPMWKAVLEVIVVSSLVTFWHVAMASARFSNSFLAGAAVILLAGFAVYPGYAAIGAAALREAWLGGGTRISYTMVPGATTSESTRGCLVLATTSHVLIGELDDNICPSLRRFSIGGSEVKPRPVHVFSRNEIEITEGPGGQ